MKTVVVYGGRFQPPHRGHISSYTHLANKFGDNVYMASADKAQGTDDPFTWQEKKRIAAMMGVPSSKFVKVANVYAETAIRDAIPYNPDDTVLILAVSRKDGDRLISAEVDDQGFALKKNGERAAIQWLREGATPISKGYIWAYVTPTLEFNVAGQPVTGATEIRKMYRGGSSKTRQRILHDLYGSKVTPNLQKLFDMRLGNMQTESLLREFIESLEKF